jgi:RNA polymerase sigma-70 factor (ECF subfamily)
MEAMIDESTRPNDARTAGWSEASTDRWLELFRELAEGRVVALEPLYDLAAERLYGLAAWHTGSGDDARDVVHEVFIKVAEQRDRLLKVRDPKAWLLTVTHRLAVDHRRKRRRRKAEPLEHFPFLEAVEDDPGRQTDAERMSRLVAGLPPAQRDAVYLRHFADCSFAEIGRIVGAPTFTAASRYRLGIRKLRQVIGGSDG